MDAGIRAPNVIAWTGWGRPEICGFVVAARIEAHFGCRAQEVSLNKFPLFAGYPAGSRADRTKDEIGTVLLGPIATQVCMLVITQ